ncbi:MAG: multidrug efflux RND transporter permease subunit [Muribaculaceae bacterium]|nr:multidrug efflux RND transporter permease subunit [Muribaculaceae bacterium]
MFSRFFIRRPIFATVIAIIMVIGGLMTVKYLPVAQYPNITPPTVQVSAVYPGADAKTVAETVGVPIEAQVNGIEGMLYMSSNSGADGSYNLTITFENGTDVDMATVKVQNRVELAQASLPTSVKQQGVSVTSHSTDNVLFVALESDDPERYDALFLTNYANLNIVDPLSRVEGVGGVQAFGAGSYSMRVWLNPELMRARGVSPQEVAAAIESQNVAVSSGAVGADPAPNNQSFQYTLTSQGRLQTADEFGNIIVKTGADGSFLRLKDIARIDLGSNSYSATSKVNGTEAGLLGISQFPGANALEVAKAAKEKLDELSQYFPEGVHYRIILDTTKFVDASIDEVLWTFVLTTLIVMAVILLFLQNWRAVIIPMITIPVSLIATFAVMKLFGFTINTLTLFGLVLAIAIVVDDAIVVVEDCMRLIKDEGLSPTDAAEKAMKELQGAIVGEVLVLLAVFVPTAFISGITGELYKQFALTIAISTAFSGLNALTFTPAMCALFLKNPKPMNAKLFTWFNKAFQSSETAYTNIVAKFLRRPMTAIAIFLAICAAAFYGFLKFPTTYIPQEDMGYFMGSVQLPSGASLERTQKVVDKLSAQLQQLSGVKDVMAISGFSFIGGGAGSNMGSMFVVLEPWADRKKASESVFALVNEANAAGAQEQEAIFFAINPPAIPGLGATSGLSMQLLDINNMGPAAMMQAIDDLRQEAEQDKRIASITSLYEGAVPQFKLEINRDKVEMEQLQLADVFATLSAYLGGEYVNDFVDFGRVYQVNLMADSRSRALIASVPSLSVRNASGDMVPFASFSKIVPSMGESSVSRYNMYTTAGITATPAKGVSSSDAIKAMEDLVKDTLGQNFSYSWTGEAYQETQAGTTITMVLIFAVIITILVLAAQYESWADPFAVVLSMPTAILGTVLGCILMSQPISIYTQIGIILLLGLSAKNAILIVEYAIQYHREGQPIQKAAADAGRVRFRPIMMTALAFVFGVLPMLFASGAGAESRISLGTAVVFGMAVNALVGTLFVPNFWEMCQKAQNWFTKRK